MYPVENAKTYASFRDCITNPYIRVTLLVVGIIAIIVSHYFLPNIARQVTITAGSLMIALSLLGLCVDTNRGVAQKNREVQKYGLKNVQGFTCCFGCWDLVLGGNEYLGDESFIEKLKNPDPQYHIYTAIEAFPRRVNMRDENLETPLHHFARQGLDVNFLINRGADISAVNNRGETALQIATAQNQQRAIDDLSQAEHARRRRIWSKN